MNGIVHKSIAIDRRCSSSWSVVYRLARRYWRFGLITSDLSDETLQRSLQRAIYPPAVTPSYLRWLDAKHECDPADDRSAIPDLFTCSRISIRFLEASCSAIESKLVGYILPVAGNACIQPPAKSRALQDFAKTQCAFAAFERHRMLRFLKITPPVHCSRAGIVIYQY